MARNSYKARPRRGLGGFTLVELVVVIAVLAILAGVGAVAYNGYIEYAKKGQDRATVGEIEHALELAEYADPGMIGYTDVFFTSDNGITVPADTSGKITAALEDAFGAGALGGIVPSYENWAKQSYSFDPVKIKELLGEANLEDITELTDYINAVSGGGSASFAGDVQPLWDTVENIVNLVQAAADRPDSAESKAMFGQLGIDASDAGHLLDKTISQTNTNKQTIIDAWSNGSDFPPDNHNFLATRVARNYAFVSYAKKQNLTEKQKTNLDNFTSNIALLAKMDYYNEPTSMTSFTAIAKQYVSSGQAKIDALAYVAMMETTEIIGKDTSGNIMTDQALIEKFGGYTDSLSAILGDPTILDYVTSSTSELSKNVSGNGIRIKVTKVDGKLAFDVYPDGANPKTSGGSDGSEESAACNLNHDGMSTTAKINFTLIEDKKYTSTETVQLCSKNYSNFGSCVLTLMDPAQGNSGVISLKDTNNPVNVRTVTINSSETISCTKNTENDTITVSATSVGEGSITVTINSKTTIGNKTTDNTRTFTINVNVH